MYNYIIAMDVMNMKKAFTTAELLIGLGIIGVTATLVLPQLAERYHKNLYSTRIKKAYTTIVSAVEAASADSGVSTFAQTKYGSCNNNEEFLKKYLKVDGLTYYTKSYRSIRKGSGGYIRNRVSGPWVLLKDGSAIKMVNAGGASKPRCIFYVDTNGPSEPNIGGRDLFVLEVNTETNEIKDYNPNFGCTMYSLGYGCFNKLLQNDWMMEY